VLERRYRRPPLDVGRRVAAVEASRGRATAPVLVCHASVDGCGLPGLERLVLTPVRAQRRRGHPQTGSEQDGQRAVAVVAAELDHGAAADIAAGLAGASTNGSARPVMPKGFSQLTASVQVRSRCRHLSSLVAEIWRVTSGPGRHTGQVAGLVGAREQAADLLPEMAVPVQDEPPSSELAPTRALSAEVAVTPERSL